MKTSSSVAMASSSSWRKGLRTSLGFMMHMYARPRFRMAKMLQNSDRAAALKEFDDTKAGVKGLVDSGVTTIPSIFHHTNLRPSRPPSPTLSIPTVDLSLPRSTIIDRIHFSCRNVGFFQLINHGIPPSVIHDAISATRAFHELPAGTRARYYTRDEKLGFIYFSNIDLFQSCAASWVDSLRVHMGLVEADPDLIPEVCRGGLIAWDVHGKRLAKRVMRLMCEGLGVWPERLEGMKCLEAREMVAHYYPSCPEPERTLGITAHTDAALLTVLIEDQIGGLQVKMKGEDGDEYWVDVEPIPGALVINVGDLLQIFSNEEYKSGEHRARANSQKESRVSIATFFTPARETEKDLLGPLPELISPKKPALYKNFNMLEYKKTFLSKELGSKSLADHFKLPMNLD